MSINDTLSRIVFETLESFFTLKLIPEFYLKEGFFSVNSFVFCRILYKDQNRISGTLTKQKVIDGIQTTLLGAALNFPLYESLSHREILNSKITFCFADNLEPVDNIEKIEKDDGIWLKYNNYSAISLPADRKYDNIDEELDFLCKKSGILSRCWKDKENGKIEKFKLIKYEVRNER